MEYLQIIKRKTCKLQYISTDSLSTFGGVPKRIF